MFEVVEDGETFDYRYAAPDSEPYRRESILAWESIQCWEPPVDHGLGVGTCPNVTSSSNVHGAHPDGKRSPSWRKSNEDISPTPTKTVGIPFALKGTDPTELETKSTKSNRASRAFRKMNARVSEFVHRKAAIKDKKNDSAIGQVTVDFLPSTPIRGMHESKSDSPFKQQMNLEADGISQCQEKVNKEFFTPPRTSNPNKDIDGPDADADVFD